MIKFLLSILLCMAPSVCHATNLFSNAGQNGPTLIFGNTAGLSATTQGLNAAFVNGTSGTAIGIRFTSPVTQTTSSFVVYTYLPSANTGSPTSVQFDVYAGYTSGAINPSPTTGAALATQTIDATTYTPPAWVTVTFPSVSFTKGLTYWVVISNTTATPASNFPTFQIRGLTSLSVQRMAYYLTVNGFTTSPTAQASEAPAVLKFSDGTIMGNPYAVSTAHASNSNYRGVRFKFSAPVKVAGFLNNGFASANLSNWYLYQGTTQLDTGTYDYTQQRTVSSFFFTSSVVFKTNTAYDIVFKASVNTTAGTNYGIGASPPADVSSCALSSQSSLDGAALGSLTATANSTSGIILLIDDFQNSQGFFN